MAIAARISHQAAKPLYFIKPETVGKSGGRGGPLEDEGGSLPTIYNIKVLDPATLAGLDSRGLRQAV
ncbi:MAG: hypothetical protein WBQ11_21530, partial [Isosphaeraceae bacterium]